MLSLSKLIQMFCCLPILFEKHTQSSRSETEGDLFGGNTNTPKENHESLLGVSQGLEARKHSRTESDVGKLAAVLPTVLNQKTLGILSL
jgi:hypothetical protein